MIAAKGRGEDSIKQLSILPPYRHLFSIMKKIRGGGGGGGGGGGCILMLSSLPRFPTYLYYLLTSLTTMSSKNFYSTYLTEPRN